MKQFSLSGGKLARLMHSIVERVVKAGNREEVDVVEDEEPFEEGRWRLRVVDYDAQQEGSERVGDPVGRSVESLDGGLLVLGVLVTVGIDGAAKLDGVEAEAEEEDDG